MSSIRRFTDLAGEGPPIARNASPRAPPPPIRMSHISIFLLRLSLSSGAAWMRRPTNQFRQRLGRLLLLRLLRQHALQIVEQRLGTGSRLVLGRDAFLAGVAKHDARKLCEGRGHLAARYFSKRLPELGRLRGELRVVREDDI